MKVLIVDDSAIVRVRLADLLYEVEGIHVVAQAEDAVQALEAVGTLNPAAVIVDVRMPRGSGIDLIEELKSTRQSPKIIVFTNYPTLENRDKCFSRGADYFFDKSMEIEEMIGVLTNLQRASSDQSH